VVRGEPYLAPVIETLKQTGTYSTAELHAAVVNSCFAVTTKTQNGDGVDLPDSGATDEKRDSIKLGSSGLVVDLLPDETIESFTPGRPSAAFDPVHDRRCCARSAWRSASPTRSWSSISRPPIRPPAARCSRPGASIACLRDWHAWSICQPFYEAVITEAVARGRLAAPGFFADPLTRAAWLGCEWYGEAPGTLDPLKEVEAQGKAVAYGFTTGERATIELNGGDWDQNHRRLVHESTLRRDGRPDRHRAGADGGRGVDPAADPNQQDQGGAQAARPNNAEGTPCEPSTPSWASPGRSSPTGCR
jgi:capsid protein